MLYGKVNWDKVLDTIGYPSRHWIYHTQLSTKPRHLENIFLNRDTRIWLQVVISRLRPMAQAHSITLDCCILLHYLVMGQDINLGKALHHHMQHVASSSVALAFPSTIIAMALQAGVLVDDDEEMVCPQD